MSLIQYTAEVKDNLLLELPSEAEELELKPGDMVEVRLRRLPAVSSLTVTKEEASPSTKPRKLSGQGAFKGKLGGTEALFQEKGFPSQIAFVSRSPKSSRQKS